MSKYYKNKIKVFLKNTLRLKVKPSRIAFSLALGVFAGFAIPIGLQTVIITPVAILFQCNIPLTLTATLVSNPVTVVPLYYFYFRIGEYITGLSIPYELVSNVIESPSYTNISRLGSDTIILFLVGSILVGFLAAIPTYFISLRLIIWYRKKRGIVIEGI